MQNNDKTNHVSVLKAKTLADTFAELEGRRPRLLLFKLDQDILGREIKFMASAYADLGFDVDLAPLYQSAKDISKQAVENDVHAIHLSSLAQNSIYIIPEIIESLSIYGCDDILIVIDGNHLTDENYQTLYDAGVQIILKPGTVISDAAIQILTLIME